MNKNKLLLISSIAVSNIGDIMFDLFIAWELSNVSGHFMNAVYIIGTSIAFRALLCFFVGSFVDKYPKKKIMIYSHISSIVVILGFSFLWEVIKLHVSIGLLFVLLNDINNELFTRSYISMTADMFNDNEYIEFQSQANIVTRTVTIGGSACVGILITYISSHAIFFIDILSYIFSLLLIFPIIYKENKIQKASSAKVLDVIVSDIKYTFKTILKSSYLSSFVILMFVLNLAYGYIPYILPIFKANILKSSTLLGMLKSSITIGEIIGLAFVSRMSKYVSASFKVSMICNIFIIDIIYLSKNQYVLIILFALYGFSDSLTQALFGYTVSNLDDVNRGKLLGGIDAIILFSPSIGIYLISAISNFNVFIAGALLSDIFLLGFFIVSLSREWGILF